MALLHNSHTDNIEMKGKNDAIAPYQVHTQLCMSYDLIHAVYYLNVMKKSLSKASIPRVSEFGFASESMHVQTVYIMCTLYCYY